MTLTLMDIIPRFQKFSHPPETHYCPHCRSNHFCPKNGTYKRYDPDSSSRKIRIQRYLCRNPDCPAVTFSVLPYRVLPFKQISIFLLWILISLAAITTASSLAKVFDCSRSTIRRRVSWARRFVLWISKDCPISAVSSWCTFCNLIYHAFFPARLQQKPINKAWPFTST